MNRNIHVFNDRIFALNKEQGEKKRKKKAFLKYLQLKIDKAAQ